MRSVFSRSMSGGMLGAAIVSLASASPETGKQLESLTADYEKALARARETIDRQYATALKALLDRAMKAGDLDAAVRIKAELDAAVPVEENRSFHGSWTDRGKSTRIEFSPNGLFKEFWNNHIQEGRWRAKSANEVRMTLKSGAVHEFRISDDGKSVKRLGDGLVWWRDPS